MVASSINRWRTSSLTGEPHSKDETHRMPVARAVNVMTVTQAMNFDRRLAVTVTCVSTQIRRAVTNITDVCSDAYKNCVLNMPAPSLAERLCILAHDLNNGLGVIGGNCQLLAEHPHLDPECAKRLRVILETVERLASRINCYECRMSSCAARDVRS
jgi:nitrogen-specific signal transduction histidine kinase